MSNLFKSVGFIVLAFGIALLLSQPGASVQPGWQSVTGIPAYGLNINSGFTAAMLAPLTPPERVQLPNSALGTTNTVCSVETSEFPPTPTCSASSAPAPVKCSANCDSGTTCSVFENSPTGDGLCSTIGNGEENFCSTLNREVPATGDANCSAYGAGSPSVHVVCSTSGVGPTQACSVKNTPRPSFMNYCSAVGGGQQPADRGADCSTFFGSQASGNKFACSAFKRRGSSRKFCSAIGGNNCSTVIEGSTGNFKGKCTAMRFAYPSTCSTLNGDPANGFCSVVTTGTGPDRGICGAH